MIRIICVSIVKWQHVTNAFILFMYSGSYSGISSDIARRLLSKPLLLVERTKVWLSRRVKCFWIKKIHWITIVSSYRLVSLEVNRLKSCLEKASTTESSKNGEGHTYLGIIFFFFSCEPLKLTSNSGRKWLLPRNLEEVCWK